LAACSEPGLRLPAKMCRIAGARLAGRGRRAV